MKKNIYKIATAIFSICTMAAVTACSSDDIDNEIQQPKGTQLTISATVSQNSQKTIYADNGTSGMGVSWSATEDITVVSFDESGITAVDKFTSTGTEGRDVAEFTGTWTGNAGDKVICLYPAITTITTDKEGAFYSNVAKGESVINFTFAAHAPTQTIADLSNWDAMVGDVTISGSNASVALNRQIAVFKIGFTGTYYDNPDFHYIDEIGICAVNSSSESILFGKTGTLAVTKSTYTGSIVPTTYQESYRSTLAKSLTAEGTFIHYYPVFANGTLNAGDKLIFKTWVREKFGYSLPTDKYEDSTTKTLKTAINIQPGYVYSIGTISL